MHSQKPIFADPTRRRWRKIRRVLFYAAAIGTALIVILITSILLDPLVRRVNLAPPAIRLFHRAKARAHKFQSARRPEFKPKGIGSEPKDVSQTKLSAFYVNWDGASYSSLRSHARYLDHLYPQWIFLEDKSGSMELREDGNVMGLAEDYPALKIIPLVMNYDETKARWMDRELNEALNHETSRRKMVDDLTKIVLSEKYGGLMVDFEYVASATRKNYILYLTDLANSLHAVGKRLEVSVEFDRPDAIDYRAIGEIADGVVLMAYDENAETTLAGPICSIPWFSKHLNERQKEIPADKLTVALGNYGYDWTGSSRHPRSMDFSECLRLASESDATIDFDSESLNPTFNYVDDKNQEHEVWFLDSITAYNEMQVSMASGVSRFALWRLGIEDNSLWGMHSSGDRTDLEKSFAVIDQGPRLAYEGEGDMILVKEAAAPGQRKVEWETDGPLISDTQILSYPKSFLLTRYGRAEKKVAITFDDGPDPKYTPKILEILKRYNVHADFFVIGLNAEDERRLVRREYAEGHEVGNHTFSHPNIADVPLRQLELELNSTQRLIESIIGRNTILFRPPFNVDADPSTPEEAAPIAFASKLGYVTVGAGNDSGDYLRPGADNIVSTTLQQLANGNIILLHDGGGNRDQTVEALPKIIEKVRERGYEIVPLSTLLKKKRTDIMQPLTRNQQYLRWANKVSFGIGDFFIVFSKWGLIVGVALGVLQFLAYSVMAMIQRSGANIYLEPYLRRVDVIVPAYNEEKVISYTIKSLLQSEEVGLKIIVVDDGSTDDTLGVLRREFGDHEKIRIVTQQNGGKASALNHGLVLSDAEIVVTLDSDTIFTADCVQKLVRPFNDPTVTAVAGNAKVGNRVNILTRWQALEYITTQNFIRRSNSLINCITVVPGAVGAWRREMLLKIGGYAGDTLAEDGEMTIRVLEAGGKIVYADGAVAWTEAPQNLKNLFRQRFRWMYGTFQTAWKHRGLLFNTKRPALGWIAMPNMYMFQVVFPFMAPLMDVVMFFSLIFFLAQRAYHPADFAADQFKHVVFFYSIFLLFDLATAVLSIFLEPKREDFSLLVWLPWQRFFYRQLNHIIALRTMFTAMRGQAVGWGHITRNATHLQYFTESGLSETDPATINKAIMTNENEIDDL